MIDGMLQYYYKNMPTFRDEEVTKLLLKHKHYEVGSSKDYDNYPYSNLFGNVITHSLDAMKKWNLLCNPLMIYMQFEHTIQEGIRNNV